MGVNELPRSETINTSWKNRIGSYGKDLHVLQTNSIFKNANIEGSDGLVLQLSSGKYGFYMSGYFDSIINFPCRFTLQLGNKTFKGDILTKAAASKDADWFNNQTTCKNAYTYAAQSVGTVMDITFSCEW